MARSRRAVVAFLLSLAAGAAGCLGGADAGTTITCEDLSAAGRTAFETGLDAGGYEARDCAFPDELRTHDCGERNQTCYCLHRPHSDTSMYELCVAPAAS